MFDANQPLTDLWQFDSKCGIDKINTGCYKALWGWGKTIGSFLGHQKINFIRILKKVRCFDPFFFHVLSKVIYVHTR